MMERTTTTSRPPSHPQTAPQQGPVKLFIGGLTGDMTRDMLAEYFKGYAEIVDSFVVYENHKPAGFGFITVKDKRDADKILQARHSLNNSALDVKPALDRAQAKDKEESERRRKLFVGGLPKNYPDERLRECFEQCGPVQKCYVVKDTLTGKTRGFGFVIFSTDDGYNKALETPNMVINGCEVHVKAATAKSDHLTPKVSEKGASPLSKKSKKTAKSPLNHPHHYPKDKYGQLPVNTNHNQFHTQNFSFPYEEYDPQVHSQSQINGSYYLDYVKQAPSHPYVSYPPSPVFSNHPSTYYGNSYQYPLQPVQSSTAFFSPQPVHSIGHPLQHGGRIQLHPMSHPQIYHEPAQAKPLPGKPMSSKHTHSSQALAYRMHIPAGGSMVNTQSSLHGQSAMIAPKSAHFIGVQPRHFNKSEIGHPRNAQAIQKKYAQNPFGVQDEDDEEIPEDLRRAGDF